MFAAMSAINAPISKENARELSAIGNKVRWDAYRAAKLAEENAKLKPATEGEIDGFNQARLLRVRKQLKKVDDMIDEETDPSKLDRLASAAIRLNEQERQLSNRSLPPTLKASQPRAKRSASADPEPE
jgi:hypothetical protein